MRRSQSNSELDFLWYKQRLISVNFPQHEVWRRTVWPDWDANSPQSIPSSLPSVCKTSAKSSFQCITKKLYTPHEISMYFKWAIKFSIVLQYTLKSATFWLSFCEKKCIEKSKLQADSAEDFGWANLRRTDKTNVRIVNQKALK